MNILDIFLTGISLIMAAAIIFTVIVGALLATWMQVNDGKGQAYEAKTKSPEIASTYSSAQRRRRRTAAGYPCQMP